MNQTIRVLAPTPLLAALVADFLTADGHDALWWIQDGCGPVTVTTAPWDAVIAACNAVGA